MSSTFPYTVNPIGEMYFVKNEVTERQTQRCYAEYDAKRIAAWLKERALGYPTKLELRS